MKTEKKTVFSLHCSVLDNLGADCLSFQKSELEHVSINRVLTSSHFDSLNVRKDNKHFTRITLVMGSITAAFLICWWPYALLFMLEGSGMTISRPLMGNVVVLAYCNSLINPVLYMAINKDVRQSIVNLFTCKNIDKIER